MLLKLKRRLFQMLKEWYCWLEVVESRGKQISNLFNLISSSQYEHFFNRELFCHLNSVEIDSCEKAERKLISKTTCSSPITSVWHRTAPLPSYSQSAASPLFTMIFLLLWLPIIHLLLSLLTPLIRRSFSPLFLFWLPLQLTGVKLW